jgi:hypothetical protein
MDLTPRQLDPDRHRRRARLLAERAGARAMRELKPPLVRRSVRIRELIASRRRHTG